MQTGDGSENVKLFVQGKKPTKTLAGDAGIELSYRGKKPFPLIPNIVYMIPTGMFVEIPEGKCGLVKCRSGLAAKYGVHVLAGVIDSGYRGEIKVIMTRNANMAITIDDEKGDITLLDKELVISPGDRIAQMVVVDCYPEYRMVSSVDQLEKSQRGARGFGSTGK